MPLLQCHPISHVFREIVLIGVFAVAVASALARAADAGSKSEAPDPQAFLKKQMSNANLATSGTGEQFCWHAAASGASAYLRAYQAYRDPRWLDAAVEYYDFYLGKLQTDPDGYEGWIGDPISHNGTELSTDALVGDAILCGPLVAFAEIVKQDPNLQERFGKTARRYQELATRIIWEKWNKRGCYYQDGAGWGSYHAYAKRIDRKTNQWVEVPSEAISDNLNKHYSAALVLLRLWRITGNEKFKERVIQIYGRAKTLWRYFPAEDRIVWNFWMPHGPYDLEGRAPKSWVAVHPSRAGYQAGEVEDFVEVYDSGLVFEQADFERIIKTNHWMADGLDGKWRSADGTSAAGTLWSALARFDDKIRTKYEAQLAKEGLAGQINLAYLKSVMARAPGWQRVYVSDQAKVQVVKAPLQPGRDLSMTVIIPDVVEVADNGHVQLATQTRAAGKLKIELLDAAEKEVLGTLATIDAAAGTEYNAPLWDGTNPKTGKKDLGEYRIRWTLGNESRTAPVWVKQGVPRQQEKRPAFHPGEKITCDFEGPLDKRWTVEQAVLSTEQSHSGKQSLQINRTAQLKFGQDNDLPVKVTLWVFDNGANNGPNGPAWGIITGTGDKFCLRQMWRPYLNGDKTYSWLNTGENQWFSPHPAGVNRQAGWMEWIFDFTNPQNITVTGGGTPVKGLTPKFTPAGAAGIYLLNGNAGKLFVDDVTVEYPRK